MSFPAAEGVRLSWADVPDGVRAAVAEVCGSAVVTAADQRGGFSPGAACRGVCASGGRFFVKVVPESLNAHTAALYRLEAATLRQLAGLAVLRAPRLIGAVERDGWTGVVVTDVEGRAPVLPWRDDELQVVLMAVDALGDLQAPTGLPTAQDLLAERFSGWRTLLAGPHDGLPRWALDRLPELAALEERWPTVAEGDRLVHGDLRADNVLLTADGAVLVDWAETCRGSALLDLVLLAPSVAMQGGPAPSRLLSRTTIGRRCSTGQLAPLVCAFAGYLTQRSLQPPPPGLPTLRGFQAAQAVQARRWLAELLG